jgi:hypothetical protein
LTWHGYLRTLHRCADTTRTACPNLVISPEQIDGLIDRLAPASPPPVFITMDTNLMNYFFDDEGQICGITDIEHPIYGDVLFLLADIRWCRDHWFHRDDWYALLIPERIKTRPELVDLYEFLIAFQEIDIRYRSGTSHPTIDEEFYALESRVLRHIEKHKTDGMI